MTKPKVLHLDENHPILLKGLEDLGYENVLSYSSSSSEIGHQIHKYDGIVIRSRLPLVKELLERAHKLKFIARLGAGLENIDVTYSRQKGITLLAAPEGNRNAVGEHACGMLLCLMNKIHLSNQSISDGIWDRHKYRGVELSGKTIGIIGYGHTGKSFAQKLSGFDVNVLCHDILPGLGDTYAEQVSLEIIKKECDVVSLHVTEIPSSIHLVNSAFIDEMKNPFWLINTSRGSIVKTTDLVTGLQSKKIAGAALDVLEYESTSFTNIFDKESLPPELNYLIKSDRGAIEPSCCWMDGRKSL